MVANDVTRRKLIFITGHACVSACVHTCILRACVRAYVRAYVRACVRACVECFLLKYGFLKEYCLTCSVSISFVHNYNMNELDLCF